MQVLEDSGLKKNQAGRNSWLVGDAVSPGFSPLTTGVGSKLLIPLTSPHIWGLNFHLPTFFFDVHQSTRVFMRG